MWLMGLSFADSKAGYFGTVVIEMNLRKDECFAQVRDCSFLGSRLCFQTLLS